LAELEAKDRSRVIAADDPRLDVILELAQKEWNAGLFTALLPASEINLAFRRVGIEVWPETSPRLKRWFETKSQMFLDLGITVEHLKSNPRGYALRHASSPNQRLDSGNSQGDLGLHVATVSS
jgi:hypothetical protein